MRTKILGPLFVVVGLALFAPIVAGAEARKPNVLVIVANDLGYGELSCQGNPQIPTPNIDSIASNGIRFTTREKVSGTKSLLFGPASRTEGRFQPQRLHGPFAPWLIPEWVAVGSPGTELEFAL